VGVNAGTVNSSYSSSGHVLGSNHGLGGLVGANYFTSPPESGTIENSFSTVTNIVAQQETNPDFIGGLVGKWNDLGEDDGTITNSYFTDAGFDDGLGTLEPGGSSAFFGSDHNHTVYATWNFTNIWDAFDGALPHLKWEDYSTSSKSITAFNFDGLNPAVIGVIDENDGTIALTVPYGTNINNLTPTIITSSNASVSPASGVVHNFLISNPVTYTVTAADNSTRPYVVTVTVAEPPATAPSNIVLATGATPVGGVNNVQIPADGDTDAHGAVTGWATGTADQIKFTVTDTAPAVSTIAINNFPYTSGTDYTIAAATPLTVVVTTTQTNCITTVRTFTIPVVAEPPPPPNNNVGIISGGGTTYGCKDPTALNYNEFSSSDPSLCKYTNTSATNSIAYTFTKTLKYKMTDVQVKYLQIILNQDKNTLVSIKGAGSPGHETTYFGLKTRAAVIIFQKANKLKIDGIVGPRTENILMKVEK
jgi:hypothetical protein